MKSVHIDCGGWIKHYVELLLKNIKVLISNKGNIDCILDVVLGCKF